MHCSTYLSTRTGKGFDAYDERPERPTRRLNDSGSMMERVRDYLGTQAPPVTASYVPGKVIDVEVAR